MLDVHLYGFVALTFRIVPEDVTMPKRTESVMTKLNKILVSFTGSKMPAPGQTISGAPSSLSVKEKSSANSSQLVTSVFLNKTFAASDTSVRVLGFGGEL